MVARQQWFSSARRALWNKDENMLAQENYLCNQFQDLRLVAAGIFKCLRYLAMVRRAQGQPVFWICLEIAESDSGLCLSSL